VGDRVIAGGRELAQIAQEQFISRETLDGLQSFLSMAFSIPCNVFLTLINKSFTVIALFRFASLVLTGLTCAEIASIALSNSAQPAIAL
jgi:hypothetical protein